MGTVAIAVAVVVLLRLVKELLMRCIYYQQGLVRPSLENNSWH
jgi:hypothetical protein